MNLYFLSRRNWLGRLLAGLSSWLVARSGRAAVIATNSASRGGGEIATYAGYPRVTTFSYGGNPESLGYVWDGDPSLSEWSVVVVWDSVEPKCRVYLDRRCPPRT